MLSVQDLELGRGNVDHAAIAPSGVFAIETNHWQGRFARRRGELIHNEFDHPEVRKQTMGSALAVHDLLAEAGIDVWATPLLVSTVAEVWKATSRWEGRGGSRLAPRGTHYSVAAASGPRPDRAHPRGPAAGGPGVRAGRLLRSG
jgi:hypothetical protein